MILQFVLFASSNFNLKNNNKSIIGLFCTVGISSFLVCINEQKLELHCSLWILCIKNLNWLNDNIFIILWIIYHWHMPKYSISSDKCLKGARLPNKKNLNWNVFSLLTEKTINDDVNIFKAL